MFWYWKRRYRDLLESYTKLNSLNQKLFSQLQEMKHEKVGFFRDVQGRVEEWSNKNFGAKYGVDVAVDKLLGVGEETGELMHSILKMRQGIRGSTEKHTREGMDAVGDIVIYLADFCARMGWSLDDCIYNALQEVLGRDWQGNPETGQNVNA